MAEAAARVEKKAPKKKKKSSKTAKPEVLWTVRVGQWSQEKKKDFYEVVGALGSPDIPTRRMAMLFIASLVGIAGVTAISVERYWAYHKRQVMLSEAAKSKETSALAGMLKKQAEVARTRNSMLPLGSFMVELKQSSPRTPGSAAVVNLAEVEIVVECDSRETRAYIEDNLAQARSQLTDVFTALDREELLTPEGKSRLKKEIIQRLNGFLPRGKVQNMFFSKLVMG